MMGWSWHRLARMMSAQDRQVLASRVGLQPDAERLAEGLTDEAAIVERLHTLSPEARDLAIRCCLVGGQAPMEALMRLPPALQPAVSQLSQKGLAVELRVDYYNHVLAIPLEVATLVFRELVMDRLAGVVRGDGREAGVLPAAPTWATDLFRLLSHVRWQGAPLTQQGELFKRVKTQLTSTFWPESRQNPDDRYDTLLSFAEWARLVNVDRLARRIDVTTRAPEFWADSLESRWHLWFEYWQGYILSRVPYGHVIWDVLASTPDFRLVNLDALAEQMATTGLVSLMRARHGAEETVRQGARLGWLEFSRDRMSAGLTEAGRSFQVRRYEPLSESRAVVQPTGDVIVPVETPPSLLWEAEAALSLTKSGVVWTYRVDAAALDRALTEHLAPQEVLERLGALSRTELPGNVVTEIQETWRKMGQVRLLTGTVAWFNNPAQADATAKALGDLVVERLGATVLVVRTDDADAALRRIQKLGYPVRPRPEHPDEEVRRVVEPDETEYFARPQVQVYLPSVPQGRATAHPAEIQLSLMQALQAHETVRVSYRPAGWEQAIHATVYPVSVHGGVLHGVLQDESRQSFQIPLAQITEVWRYS